MCLQEIGKIINLMSLDSLFKFKVLMGVTCFIQIYNWFEYQTLSEVVYFLNIDVYQFKFSGPLIAEGRNFKYPQLLLFHSYHCYLLNPPSPSDAI